RTRAVMQRVGEKIRQSPAVLQVFEVSGFSFNGNDESARLFFVRLKALEDRKESAQDVIGWAYQNVAFSERDASVFFFNLPVISGLGQFGGFEMWLCERGAQRTGRGACAQGS